MHSMIRFGAIIMFAGVLMGCTASQHLDQVRGEDSDRITVGTVQKEIKIGMSAAEVAGALGSPNIVTTDEERRETWIYDKISSEVSYSKSSGTVVGLIFGSSGGGLGAGSTSSGAEASSQRTLTVIIKFDDSNMVRDFSYHTSRF
jgi:outer membrane protein assembly factor BamE (lipoprotein component of BamABCDE complex)